MARKIDTARRADYAKRAFEMIREHGVHKITMSTLANGLGIKRPTLYWYFKDLEAIFGAVLENILAEQDAFIAERLVGHTHPIDLIYAHLQAVHEFFAGREDTLLILTQFWAVGSSGATNVVLDRTQRYFEPRRAAGIALLEAGIAEGTVAPCDPAALLDLVASLVDGILIHRVTRQIALEPVHKLFWSAVLAPLKR